MHEMLLKKCIAGGDQKAWAELTEKCLPIVFSTIHRTFDKYSFTPCVEDVDDLHNSLFLSLMENNFKKLRQFKAGCSLCLEQIMLGSKIKKEQEHIDFKSRAVDVIVSFLKSTVEVIKRADIRVLPFPSPAPVRGRQVLMPNAVKFNREFSDIKRLR